MRKYKIIINYYYYIYIKSKKFHQNFILIQKRIIIICICIYNMMVIYL